ncbi:hypothetical protein BD324DRAFT_614531 [Kockovaella imperatae]|uniref:HIT-type domain-containing protein n=1 Tax=Kockovaella imperatae TaxID=4999 RepID=A0A1Y1UQ87_9TREE|nr:hypothetical protein BD324DRAFT_614531 [Kockovaella imperatae]ORX39664.1 hypothetical protein BD324DRAFT_614531 [Kockovaella imperatae]
MPGKTAKDLKCQVCHESSAKYRCPGCPTRYCSVQCFKLHKLNACQADAKPDVDASKVEETLVKPDPDGILDVGGIATPNEEPPSVKARDGPLKPLTELLWPPEPDPSIFMDPLTREDPKPLRHEELLRIATSSSLRYLLSSTPLPRILKILDSLPTASARSSCLARLLGLDPISMAKPDNPILNQRDSPPPLEDLLRAAIGENKSETGSGAWADDEGWWLECKRGEGPRSDNERIWIGSEERRVMRLFASVVCREIDGDKADSSSMGKGHLEWEV